MDNIDHASWLGFAIEKALAAGLTQADKLLIHLTPEVVVSQLPQELTTQLINNALSSGKMTAESLLEVASPRVLAKHIDAALLWGCVSDVAQAHKLDQKGAAAAEPARRWLGEALRHALELGLVTPAEVVGHVPPAEWVKDAPLEVVAEMIRAGLTRGAFNPELALQHLTPKLIAEKLQPLLSWGCLVDGMNRILSLAVPRSAKADAGAGKTPLAPTPMPIPGVDSGPLPLPQVAQPPAQRRSKGGSKGFDSPDTNVEGLEVLDEAPLPPPPPGAPAAHRRA